MWPDKEFCTLETWNLTKKSPVSFARFNNNNTRDDIFSTIIHDAIHMREFTLGHLCESRSAPGGCELVGQAAN